MYNYKCSGVKYIHIHVPNSKINKAYNVREYDLQYDIHTYTILVYKINKLRRWSLPLRHKLTHKPAYVLVTKYNNYIQYCVRKKCE